MTNGIVVIQQKSEAQLTAEAGTGACAMPDGTYGAAKGSPAAASVTALAEEIELNKAGFKTMGTAVQALEILGRKNAVEPLRSCPADAVGSGWKIEPKAPGGPAV